MQKKQNFKVFINYRKRISSDQAQELKDRINQMYAGPDEDIVFLDVESIDIGTPWPDTIRAALEQANVLLALIGPDWFIETFPHNKYSFRLKDPHDWVRNEIARALEKEKNESNPFFILPLNYEEDYPKEEVIDQFLPPELIPFFRKQAMTIRSDKAGFAEDLTLVLRKIGELLQKNAAENTPETLLQTRQRLPVPDKYKIPKSNQPFIGLKPFVKEDCALFFGRDQDISDLIGKVQAAPLVLLTGKSGAGKSSLLDAGLLPRLETQFRWSDLPRRRDKTQGLHLQLQAMLEQVPPHSTHPSLYILDQVEEMYTNEPVENEPAALVNLVHETLSGFPAARIVLGYRKEFHKDLLDLFRDLRPTVFELRPLDPDGLLEACLSVSTDPVVDKPVLNFQFEYHPERGSLAQQIVADLERDQNSSHSAPLLQVQLTKMWEKADGERNHDDDPLVFTFALYDQDNHASLREFLHGQLRQLEQSSACERWLHNGLALDVLHAHTTAQGTAGACTYSQLCERYDASALEVLLPTLKRLHLLNDEQIKRAVATRLAHDSLAPLVIDLFLNSEAPGQRAHHILEAKKREIPPANFTDTERRLVFSPADLEIVAAGLEGMAKTDSAVLQQMDYDRRTYAAQSRQRHQLAMREAREALENFQSVECLQSLRLAIQEAEHQLDEVQQLCLELAWHEHQSRKAAAFKAVADFWSGCMPNATALDFDNFNQQLPQHWPALWLDLEFRYQPNLIALKKGSFKMGSTEGWKDEQPVHKVTLSSYQLADTPVTWWQYGLYCQENDLLLPSDSGSGKGDKPIINFTWKDAILFCNWLSQWQGLRPAYTWEKEGDQYPACDWKASGYRLPTEAEWEYAAREAGKKVRFGNGKNEAKPEEMNFDAANENNTQEWVQKGKSRLHTTPVRAFPPNALGLYDLSGNVWERCWDVWSESDYYEQSKGSADPHGPEDGELYNRVVRGGSWDDAAFICRASCRYRYRIGDRIDNAGFRIARS